MHCPVLTHLPCALHYLHCPGLTHVPIYYVTCTVLYWHMSHVYFLPALSWTDTCPICIFTCTVLDWHMSHVYFLPALSWTDTCPLCIFTCTVLDWHMSNVYVYLHCPGLTHVQCVFLPALSWTDTCPMCTTAMFTYWLRAGGSCPTSWRIIKMKLLFSYLAQLYVLLRKRSSQMEKLQSPEIKMTEGNCI
jgi:hypothetical protein